MDAPPFEVSPLAFSLVAEMERLLGRFEGRMQPPLSPMLRRSQRVRTVHGSVGIEGNTLTEEQITALLEGKRVAGPAAEVQEVLNAIAAYAQLAGWKPDSVRSILDAHRVMMAGVAADAGRWRKGGVGIMHGNHLVHMAPPAAGVPGLMRNLCDRLRQEKNVHPAVKAAVFHYELEFIHPFTDGNGRMGRLWHTLILTKYHDLFEDVPVESVIRTRQKEYYAALAAGDRASSATPFIEFAMGAVVDALRETVEGLRSGPVTPARRLETAARHFGNTAFTRRAYLRLFPSISTATASRDLQDGVKTGRLAASGRHALTTYQFLSAS